MIYDGRMCVYDRRYALSLLPHRVVGAGYCYSDEDCSPGWCSEYTLHCVCPDGYSDIADGYVCAVKEGEVAGYWGIVQGLHGVSYRLYIGQG